MSDSLSQYLISPTPEFTTELIVLQYLHSQPPNPSQQTVVSLNDFYHPGDLAQYFQVVASWPQDLPATYAAPNLLQLLFNYRIGPSFIERLTMRRIAVDRFLEAQTSLEPEPKSPKPKPAKLAPKRPVGRPRKEAPNPALASRAAWERYMALCAERKQAIAEWSERVEAARLEWAALAKKETP